MAVVEGELTVHEEVVAALEVWTDPDGVTLSETLFTQTVKLLHRIARATKPHDASTSSVEPLGMSPWDWIQSKNIRLMQACAHEGTSGAIMDMLRGMEVFAFNNQTTLEYIDVAECGWTNDGRLIITFKRGT